MIRRYALLSIALACSWGCAGTGFSPICHPGSASYQQAQAERFDPYPLPDVAPDVVGGRPLAYMQPASEAQRAQDSVSFIDRFGQPPPPGMYKQPRGTGVQQIPYIPPPPPLPPQQSPPAFGP